MKQKLTAYFGGLSKSIDIPTFDQILQMDDDDQEREFSRALVFEFLDQAEDTFGRIQDSLYVTSEPNYPPTHVAEPRLAAMRSDPEEL